MFYQITENESYGAQFGELPLIVIGNEKAIIDFVNDRNEDADELINNIGQAIEWLEENGYEIEKIRDLIERLNNGEQIFIQ